MDYSLERSSNNNNNPLERSSNNNNPLERSSNQYSYSLSREPGKPPKGENNAVDDKIQAFINNTSAQQKIDVAPQENVQKPLSKNVVTFVTQNGDSVTLKASELAQMLNVRTSVVKQASKHDAVQALVDGVRNLSEDLVADLSHHTNLPARDVTALAVVISELQDKGTILGKEVEHTIGLKPYARRKQYKIPLSLQAGENREVYVQSKEHKVKRLGAGSFGKVTKSVVVSSSGEVEPIVQKTQSKEINRFLGLVKEKGLGPHEASCLKIVKEANVPYVIRLHEAGFYAGKKKANKSVEKYGLMMERCDGGSVSQSKLKNLAPSERWELFAKVLEGAHGIHEAGLVHRDYKGDNILLKTNNEGMLEPRIIDLGLAAHIGISDTPEGTMEYLPPEVVFGKTMQSLPSLDTWSLGVVGLKEFAGVQPPIGLLVGKGLSPTVNWKKVNPPEIASVLKEMLDPNPSNRIDLGEAISRIRAAIPQMKSDEDAKKKEQAD